VPPEWKPLVRSQQVLVVELLVQGLRELKPVQQPLELEEE
jgi:hypothetical protein